MDDLMRDRRTSFWSCIEAHGSQWVVLFEGVMEILRGMALLEKSLGVRLESLKLQL